MLYPSARIKIIIIYFLLTHINFVIKDLEVKEEELTGFCDRRGRLSSRSVCSSLARPKRPTHTLGLGFILVGPAPGALCAAPGSN